MGHPGRSLPLWLLLSLLVPGPARAADLRVQGSTQYYWYTDPFLNDGMSDVVQYLKLSAPAIDNAGRFSAAGYGRVSKQFGGDDNRAFGNDEDLLGRLYFLYAGYALPADRGDLRLGRQYVAVGAGAGTVDGLRVDVRRLGPVTVSLFGGYDVRFAQTTDRTRSGNYLTGASAGGSLLKGNNAEVSYLRKYDDGDVIREIAGFHVDQRFLGKAKAYLDWRYDVLHDSNDQFLVGLKAVPFPGLLTLTAEYFNSYPNFDADTIFTAFAVTRYREYLARADWILGPQVTLYGAYTRADYDGPSADVATLGASCRPARVAGLALNGSVDYRNGYPGDLTGFQASAGYGRRKAVVAAGVTYDVFQRDSMADDFSARKFWGGASYELRKNLLLKVRAEDSVTRQFKSEVQGRASVEYAF